MLVVAIISLLLFVSYHQSNSNPFLNLIASAACILALWILTPAAPAVLMLCGLLAFITLQFIMPLADPRPSRWLWQAGRLQVAMVVA